MANRSQALYLRQLYRVRQKAQRRLPNELLETAGRIETHLAAQPKFTDETFCNHLNTPYIQQFHLLLREVREQGLIVDEHRDFQEEIEQQRQAKGKGNQFVSSSDPKRTKWPGEGTHWQRKD